MPYQVVKWSSATLNDHLIIYYELHSFFEASSEEYACRCFQSLLSVPTTFPPQNWHTLHLKIDGWKPSFWVSAYFQVLLLSVCRSINFHLFFWQDNPHSTFWVSLFEMGAQMNIQGGHFAFQLPMVAVFVCCMGLLRWLERVMLQNGHQFKSQHFTHCKAICKEQSPKTAFVLKRSKKI